MTRWREAILLLMVTGFVWCLFATPQQGATSLDNRARQGLRTSQEALQTAGHAAGQILLMH
jgi:hypothetical protein